jgi:hypothetical protein
MPLYMEFHKSNNLSMADLQEKAIAGHKLLNKFSVRYHQLWINEEAGTVFCLIEGPSRSICETVHRSLYGVDFGTCTVVRQCLDLDKNELPKNGFASSPILKGHGFMVSMSITPIQRSEGDQASESAISRLTNPIIEDNDGMVASPEMLPVQVFFSSAEKALNCASQMGAFLLDSDLADFKIAVLPSLISSEEAENESVKRARHMQSIIGDSSVIISSHLREYLRFADVMPPFRILTAQEESFMEVLLNIADDHLHDEKFNVDSL